MELLSTKCTYVCIVDNILYIATKLFPLQCGIFATSAAAATTTKSNGWVFLGRTRYAAAAAAAAAGAEMAGKAGWLVSNVLCSNGTYIAG